MDLKVSYNWIREHVGLTDSAEDFARRISLSGPTVDRSYPQAPQFEHMVVGRIVELKPHPNADKLRVAVTDLGKSKEEIVCGGINLTVGMRVVVALPGATVRWHGEGEPIVLEPAEIRGVKSAGMICGASEIGLEDAFPHAGKEIMDMSWCKAKPGTRLAKALDLEDTVFDIEVTGNRPDAFSVVGLARESAAILEAPFTWKDPVVPTVAKSVEEVPLSVEVAEPGLCPRYTAVVMDSVEVGPSPWWLKNRLRMSGIRSINNVVDITNYVMLELGQPMHAFDYAKLEGGAIRVRKAKSGERLLMLDGSEAKLSSSHLVIADAKRPVAVAGVMGGEESGVSEGTSTIVFESATFDPVSVRRTGRDLDLRSDSSLRFEKGLPPEQAVAALARAVELCQKVACGRVVSRVHDVSVAAPKKVKFQFRTEQAEKLIGVRIPATRMSKILKSLGFGVARRSTVKKGRAVFDVEVPFWRRGDIKGERDFAEEVARVYGYENLPSVIPDGVLPVRPVDAVLSAEDEAKRYLAAAGFTELLNYSFVPSVWLERSGFDPESCVRLSNPLSTDFELMRPSLIPGLLSVVESNQGLFPEGSVFEISNIYIKNDGASLPDERVQVMVAAYGPEGGDRLFRQVRGAVEGLVARLGRQVEIVRAEPEGRLWHPGRTVHLQIGDTDIGTLGEVHPMVREAFGVDGRVAVAEFDLQALLDSARVGGGYEPVAQYPPVRRDIAFVVDEPVEYADVEAAVRGASGLLRSAELFDIYRGKGIGEGRKSVALHLSFQHDERTLTAEDVDAEMESILKALDQKVGAEIRK